MPHSSSTVQTTVLRGNIVNRTYGTHENLYICLFLPLILVLFTIVPRNSTRINSVSRTETSIILYFVWTWGVYEYQYECTSRRLRVRHTGTSRHGNSSCQLHSSAPQSKLHPHPLPPQPTHTSSHNPHRSLHLQ